MSLTIAQLAECPIPLLASGSRVNGAGRQTEVWFLNTPAIRYMIRHGRDSLRHRLPG